MESAGSAGGPGSLLGLEDPRAKGPAAPSRVLENNRDCVVRGVAERGHD